MRAPMGRFAALLALLPKRGCCSCLVSSTLRMCFVLDPVPRLPLTGALFIRSDVFLVVGFALAGDCRLP